jgi:hypothetical protein
MGQYMDTQLGGRMYGSMSRLYASQRLINKLGRKDQYRTLISPIHRMTKLISVTHAKDQNCIGVGNDGHPMMIHHKDSTARHDDLGNNTPFLITPT